MNYVTALMAPRNIMGSRSILESNFLCKTDHRTHPAIANKHSARLVATACWLLEKEAHCTHPVVANKRSARLVATACWLLEKEAHCTHPVVANKRSVVTNHCNGIVAVRLAPPQVRIILEGMVGGHLQSRDG